MHSRRVLWALMPLFALSLAWVPTTRVEAGFHHHRRGCGCTTCHHRGWHRGCHGSSGGSSGGGSSGGSAGGAAAPPKAAAAAPATPAPGPAKAAASVPADGAVLVVEVPENARLFINGQPTTLTGGVRHFFASDLSAENRYAYDVRVAFGDTGKEESRKVWLEAGQRQVVSFAADRSAATDTLAFPAPAAAAPTTNLTLRVPEDARVFIAGRPTAHGGTVRRYSTTALAAGESWDDYEVRVVSVVDGREREVVRRLTLTGGKDLEVALDPAGPAAPVAGPAAPVATTAALE